MEDASATTEFKNFYNNGELQCLITVCLNKIYGSRSKQNTCLMCSLCRSETMWYFNTNAFYSCLVWESAMGRKKEIMTDWNSGATTYCDLCRPTFPCIPQNPGLLWENFNNKIFLVGIHKQPRQSPRSNLFLTQMCTLYKPVRLK